MIKAQSTKRSFNRNALSACTQLILLMGSLAAVDAHAGPNAKVYAPYVEYGETELELAGGGEYDDGEKGKQRYSLALGHGVTQYWFTEAFAKFEKQPGRAEQLKGYGWENIFQLAEQGEYWVDPALYLEYFFADSGVDKAEAKLLLGKDIGMTTNLLNLIFEREVGAGAGHEVEFEYAWETRWRASPSFEYGFQAFGSFGELGDLSGLSKQEHRIGPAVFGQVKLSNTTKFKYDTALTVGLTDATPDYTWRFNVEYEF